MPAASWIQLGVLIALVGVTAPLLGRYMARVYDTGPDAQAPGDRFFLRLERPVYRLCGVDPHSEQRWTTYATSLLGFSLVSFVFLYALIRLQGSLPFNPTNMAAPDAHLAFNTAVSFMTNTNWQSYGGEATLLALHPDGRAVGAELRVGRRRHGRAGRLHPGPGAPAGARRSATSGST